MVSCDSCAQRSLENSSQLAPLANIDRNNGNKRRHPPEIIETTYGRYVMRSTAIGFENHDSKVKEESP